MLRNVGQTLGHFGAFRMVSDPLWAVGGQSGTIRKVWPLLTTHFGSFEHFGPIWSIVLAHIGTFWDILEQRALLLDHYEERLELRDWATHRAHAHVVCLDMHVGVA